MKRAAIILTLLLLPSVSFAGYRECIEATVRIRSGNASGTGCCFHRQDGWLFALTNAHVVGQNQGALVDSWLGGNPKQTQNAVVVFKKLQEPYIDVAVIAWQDDGSTPVIPLLSPQVTPDYRSVYSVGSPRGEWPTAFMGHGALDNGSGTIRFQPSPADGRSGSALFDASGSVIIGLVAWRGESGGIAQNHAAVIQSIWGQQSTAQAIPYTEQVTPLQFSREFCPQCLPQLRPQQPGPSLPPPGQAPVLPSLPSPGQTAPTGNYVTQEQLSDLNRQWSEYVRAMQDDHRERLGETEAELKGELKTVAEETDQAKGLVAKVREDLGGLASREDVRAEIKSIIGGVGKRVIEDDEGSLIDQVRRAAREEVAARLEPGSSPEGEDRSWFDWLVGAGITAAIGAAGLSSWQAFAAKKAADILHARIADRLGRTDATS